MCTYVCMSSIHTCRWLRSPSPRIHGTMRTDGDRKTAQDSACVMNAYGRRGVYSSGSGGAMGTWFSRHDDDASPAATPTQTKLSDAQAGHPGERTQAHLEGTREPSSRARFCLRPPASTGLHLERPTICVVWRFPAFPRRAVRVVCRILYRTIVVHGLSLRPSAPRRWCALGDASLAGCRFSAPILATVARTQPFACAWRGTASPNMCSLGWAAPPPRCSPRASPVPVCRHHLG